MKDSFNLNTRRSPLHVTHVGLFSDRREEIHTKTNVSLCLCRRVQRHPFERIATPFQVYNWTAPQVDHAMDCVRAEDAYTSRLGYEEHIPGQVGAAETSSADTMIK